MCKKPFLRAVRLFSFCLLAFASLAFASCSSADSELSSADDTPTLRYTADRLYDSTVWTEELEFDRLTTKVSSVAGISAKLNLSPLIVAAKNPSEDSKIFPSLPSFGSLDTSLISKSLREMLTSFSETLAKNKDADSFFAKDSLFSLALFYNDFNRIFGDCFELNKVEEPAQNPSESEQNTPDGEASAAELEEKIPEKQYFTSFVFGQPFLDGIFYEVPVKFFSEKATLTLSVFCFENSGVWKIDQIQIADWEIF